MITQKMLHHLCHPTVVQAIMQIDTLHQFVVEMWQRAERKWIFQSAAVLVPLVTTKG